MNTKAIYIVKEATEMYNASREESDIINEDIRYINNNILNKNRKYNEERD